MSTIEQVLTKYKPLIKATIEKWIPRVITEEYLSVLCGPSNFAHNTVSLTNGAAVPIYDMLDRGLFVIFFCKISLEIFSNMFL